MQVPRYSEQTVELSQLPGPRMSGADPIGQAVGGLGHTLQGIGSKSMQFAIEAQNKANEAAVLDASVSFGESWQKIDIKSRQRVGKDALDTKGPLDLFDQEYTRALDNLKTEEQKRLFKLHNARAREQFTLNLERHASEQFTLMNQNNAKAKVGLEAQMLTTLYRDPSQFDIKNKDSQINRLRAAAMDNLHLHGIKEGDPAFDAAMQDTVGKAYADRVRLLMTENPSEAEHFFQVHQDDIPAHEREQLKAGIAHVSEQSAGIAAAESLTPELLKGDKSYTELRKTLYEQLKDKPQAFKVAEQQLRSNYLAAKEDRSERVGGLAAKVEEAQSKAIAEGKFLSPKQIAAMPEYQALIKEGSKDALHEASRFIKQAETEQRQAERERKAELREARAEARAARQELKLSQAEWTEAHNDPDMLLATTDADIRKLGPQIGYNNVNKLITQRHKYLKDSAALERAKIDKDVIVEEMERGGLKYQVNPSKAETDDFKKTARLKNRVAQLMRYEQEATGKSVGPERQKEIIREQLLKVHVNKEHFWNKGEVMQFEAEPQRFQVPGASDAEVGMVVSVFKQRGIEPTYEMVKQGIQKLKGR